MKKTTIRKIEQKARTLLKNDYTKIRSEYTNNTDSLMIYSKKLSRKTILVKQILDETVEVSRVPTYHCMWNFMLYRLLMSKMVNSIRNTKVNFNLTLKFKYRVKFKVNKQVIFNLRQFPSRKIRHWQKQIILLSRIAIILLKGYFQREKIILQEKNSKHRKIIPLINFIFNSTFFLIASYQILKNYAILMNHE